MKNYKMILSNTAVNVIEINGVQYQLSASIDVDEFVKQITTTKEKPQNNTEIEVAHKSKQKYYKGQ